MLFTLSQVWPVPIVVLLLRSPNVSTVVLSRCGVNAVSGTAMEFRTQVYWNKRYENTEETEFEWYYPWCPVLKKEFEAVGLKPDMNVLNVGCGNSNMSLDMYDDGYQSITNCDFSAEVIAQMKYKSVSVKRNMTWVEGDVR